MIPETHLRTLKNSASSRRVPVVPQLLELGLLRYVEFVRASGSSVFFPTLKPDGVGKLSGAFVKVFSRIKKRELQMNDSRKVLYSCRTVTTGHHDAQLDIEVKGELGQVGAGNQQSRPVGEREFSVQAAKAAEFTLRHQAAQSPFTVWRCRVQQQTSHRQSCAVVAVDTFADAGSAIARLQRQLPHQGMREGVNQCEAQTREALGRVGHVARGLPARMGCEELALSFCILACPCQQHVPLELKK